MKQDVELQLAKAVGLALSQKRVEIGITQEAAAEALDIGSAAVSRIERGAVMPSLPRLVEFAELYKCPVETFLGKTTGLTEGLAESIARMLNDLDRSDRQFVYSLVETSYLHLSRIQKQA